MSIVPNPRPVNQFAYRRARIVSGFILALFLFQFARFYVTVSAERFLCLDAFAPAPRSTHAGHDHEHEHDDDHSHGSVPSNGGMAFDHCKDTLNGILLTPVQPFDSPVEIAFVTNLTSTYSRMATDPSGAEAARSPLSPPPRA